ncbi:DNA-binding protein [Streptomyces rubiginosohelvolus]|uniref:DNA-binding protein n=1 Tax=Streptomyces rubiginosohelvolus TaxID=67362 RepID=UPI0037B9E8C2
MSSPPTTDEPPYFTVEMLAERWHMTKNALYIARHRGKAPKALPGRAKILFPRDEVLAFEARQMEQDRLSNRREQHEHRPAEALRSRRAPRAAAA